MELLVKRMLNSTSLYFIKIINYLMIIHLDTTVVFSISISVTSDFTISRITLLTVTSVVSTAAHCDIHVHLHPHTIKGGWPGRLGKTSKKQVYL